ncbi:MAG: formylglycine-generating enzyme family protein [Planctomycetota bacterium]|jgi:formylglycine-generating enzyme required for sulfatase activity
MQSNIAVANDVIKYVALFAIIVAGCQLHDVVDEGGEVPKTYTETVTSKRGESISFEMVGVPGGTFVMGSPKNEVGSEDDERPPHKVHVAPFYVCATETTLELFQAYYEETMDAAYGDLTMGYGKMHPAMGMTWHNATTFCKWLSRKTGRQYRLPTEAEWECACRAGTTKVFCCGNDPDRLADFTWYKANSDGETHEVGKKKPNAWGLYDMSGNVREWVKDFYSPEAYKNSVNKSPAVDPEGPTIGKVHVARGGDYRSPTEELRCAARAFEEKWWRSGDPQIPKSKWWLPQMDFIGFRIARSIEARRTEGVK